MTNFGGSAQLGSDTTGKEFDPNSFFDLWKKRARFWAMIFAGLTLAVSTLVILVLTKTKQVPELTFLLAPFIAFLMYRWQTKKVRRRHELIQKPFPNEFEAALQQNVAFFRVLNATEKNRFRSQLKIFLGEKTITGIRVKIDTTTRVLAAASAIIPIFGFPEWEWDQINEILIYPNRFDDEFQFDNKQGQNIIGMVGTGSLNRLMILSKPDLITGFLNMTDKRNVGIHEFAHLVDKTDGIIDGIPRATLNRDAIRPWIDLMHRKMSEIEAGRSDINRYALTNEAEFFAVTSEYFFERPGVMRKKHPELYSVLEQVFSQDLRTRGRKLRLDLKKVRPSFGRNSPCPCGSKKKFKKCCLS
jgi:Mlc titration factor MtfA (ptsG expression regulator)